MAVIKQGKNYLLELEVKPYGKDLNSIEFFQTFPEAQRPRRQRLVQLNLTEDELNKLVIALALGRL